MFIKHVVCLQNERHLNPECSRHETLWRTFQFEIPFCPERGELLPIGCPSKESRPADFLFMWSRSSIASLGKIDERAELEISPTKITPYSFHWTARFETISRISLRLNLNADSISLDECVCIAHCADVSGKFHHSDQSGAIVKSRVMESRGAHRFVSRRSPDYYALALSTQHLDSFDWSCLIRL